MLITQKQNKPSEILKNFSYHSNTQITGCVVGVCKRMSVCLLHCSVASTVNVCEYVSIFFGRALISTQRVDKVCKQVKVVKESTPIFEPNELYFIYFISIRSRKYKSLQDFIVSLLGPMKKTFQKRFLADVADW